MSQRYTIRYGFLIRIENFIEFNWHIIMDSDFSFNTVTSLTLQMIKLWDIN